PVGSGSIVIASWDTAPAARPDDHSSSASPSMIGSSMRSRFPGCSRRLDVFPCSVPTRPSPTLIRRAEVIPCDDFRAPEEVVGPAYAAGGGRVGERSMRLLTPEVVDRFQRREHHVDPERAAEIALRPPPQWYDEVDPATQFALAWYETASSDEKLSSMFADS